MGRIRFVVLVKLADRATTSCGFAAPKGIFRGHPRLMKAASLHGPRLINQPVLAKSFFDGRIQLRLSRILRFN